jgi:hypothetical protein
MIPNIETCLRKTHWLSKSWPEQRLSLTVTGAWIMDLGETCLWTVPERRWCSGGSTFFMRFHLFIAGNKDGGVRTLAAGLRSSHDVGNGGSLFATLTAKDLLVNHLRAVADVLHLEQLSAAQRARLQEAVRRLGEGLDWRTAAKLDLEGLRGQYAGDSVTSTALTRIISSCVAVLEDQSKLPTLDEAIHSAPQQLARPA